jgi:hypothetical protein
VKLSIPAPHDVRVAGVGIWVAGVDRGGRSRSTLRARTPALSRVAYLLNGDFSTWPRTWVQQALLRGEPGRCEIGCTALGDPDPFVRRCLHTPSTSSGVAPGEAASWTCGPEVPEQGRADGSAAVELSHTVRRALRRPHAPPARRLLVLRYFEGPDLENRTQEAGDWPRVPGCASRHTSRSRTRHATHPRLRQLRRAELAELARNRPYGPAPVRIHGAGTVHRAGTVPSSRNRSGGDAMIPTTRC